MLNYLCIHNFTLSTFKLFFFSLFYLKLLSSFNLHPSTILHCLSHTLSYTLTTFNNINGGCFGDICRNNNNCRDNNDNSDGRNSYYHGGINNNDVHIGDNNIVVLVVTVMTLVISHFSLKKFTKDSIVSH